MVLEKATIRAWSRRRFFTSSKYFRSLGFDPGQPPSMKSMPKSSSFSVILILSFTEKAMSSDCAPSLRVVS